MDFSADFIDILYIGKEIIDDDVLFTRSAHKIFNIIKKNTDYKKYIKYLDEQSKILCGDTVEELHYNKLTEIDIIMAIMTKEVIETGMVGIYSVAKTFKDLLLSQSIEVYPTSNIKHKLIHNAMYGDTEDEINDVFKRLNLKPLGSNTKFLEEYIQYLPESVLEILDTIYNGPKIRPILTIKNADDKAIFEGENNLSGDKPDLNNITFNIEYENAGELFKGENPSLGLYTDALEGRKALIVETIGKSNRDGGLTGAIMPFPTGFISAFDTDNFESLSEGRKELVKIKMEQLENDQITRLKIFPGSAPQGFEQGISEERKNKLFNILSIKRNIELNMRVSGHTVDDGDIIIFNIDLGKTIQGKEKDITRLTLTTYEPLDFHFESFNLANGSYFDIDDFVELKFIFGTEQAMYEAIRPYTIKYLKDNNLPRWYLSECEIAERINGVLEKNKIGGQYVFTSDDCKDGIDTNYSFIIDIRTDGEVCTRLYNNIADVTRPGYISTEIIHDFVEEWNKNATEKYDWSIYNIE